MQIISQQKRNGQDTQQEDMTSYGTEGWRIGAHEKIEVIGTDHV